MIWGIELDRKTSLEAKMDPSGPFGPRLNLVYPMHWAPEDFGKTLGTGRPKPDDSKINTFPTDAVPSTWHRQKLLQPNLPAATVNCQR